MRALTLALALAAAAAAGPAARLASEPSAYLKAHADNAVAWYPWGPEALAEAARLDRPIFLSVGYSTCHWCHVMEHESFLDPEVGAALAAGFVAIKVDREERPDLDAQYMLASQILGQSGGWPNSVWLTPGLKPFAAATYLPKAHFLGMLAEISAAWAGKRAALVEQGERAAAVLAKIAAAAVPGARPAPLGRHLVAKALGALARGFDPVRGGLGAAPKFPPHHALRLMLDQLSRAPDPPRADLVALTLARMARGGIHDQLGGGFHRYSTDADWHLPHFEKMLTDNALLLRAYAQAGTLLDSAAFRAVARRTAAFILEGFSHPTGGLQTAWDADSEGEEGRFYTWSLAELAAALGPDDAKLAAAHFRATAEGNFADEATRRRSGRNVLDPGPGDEPTGPAAARLESIRTRLLAARAARVPPAKDPWVLADANGLAIGALAVAGRILAEPPLVEAAARIASAVLAKLAPSGPLHHAWSEAGPRLAGQLDDHAFLADGLLDLHEATRDPRWLSAARSLASSLAAGFEDPAGGFFRVPAGTPGILARPKDPTDGALPSGEGVAARVFVRLAALDSDPAQADRARRSFESWSAYLARSPDTAPGLIGALADFLDLPTDAPGGPAARVRIAPLTVEARLPAPPAPPGSLRITLDLVPDPGWHLAGPAPAAPGLAATTLALDPHPQLALDGFSLPLPVLRKPASLAEAAPVYDGPIQAIAVLGMGPTPPPTATLRLSTQACDDRRCLEPAVYELVVPLDIESAVAR